MRNSRFMLCQKVKVHMSRKAGLDMPLAKVPYSFKYDRYSPG